MIALFEMRQLAESLKLTPPARRPVSHIERRRGQEIIRFDGKKRRGIPRVLNILLTPLLPTPLLPLRLVVSLRDAKTLLARRQY